MLNGEKKAVRVIDTLTGPIEQRILPKMARALPPWVTPDRLTLLGIIAALLIALGYILTHVSPLWIILVNISLIVHWFADSLDGCLARVRKIERERYGYLVDHLCDAVTTFFVCLGLGASPYMELWVGMFVAIGYYLMNIYVHTATYAKGEFKLSYGKFGPTEVRIILFIANIVILFWNPVVLKIRGTQFSALDIAGIAAGVIFLMIFLVCAVRDAKMLDKLDRAEWKK